jgi:Ca2+-binding RTX toxin-like protein
VTTPATARRTRALAGAALVVLTAVAAPAAAGPGQTITGTPGDDALVGTPRADRIRGLAGDDDITGGRGDDRQSGGEGDDTFRWRNGDGHDRIDGGPPGPAGGGNPLLIDTLGRNLRLHIRGPEGGPGPAAGGGAQVITVERVDVGVDMAGAGAGYGDHDLTISTDRSVGGVPVELGRGRNRVDASGVRGGTFIADSLGEPGAPGDVVKGSAEFEDIIVAGSGDDEIWTGAGGSFVQGRGGDDTIRLGEGRDLLGYSLTDGAGRDTVLEFGAADAIRLDCPDRPPAILDTSGDGRLTARDRAVRARAGSMTIDLSPAFSRPVGTIAVTLVGRTGIALSQIEQDCSD